MERLNFKKLNEVEGKEKYRVEVSDMFAELEGLKAEPGKLLEIITKFHAKIA
jgi:hypothetical protein